MARGDNNLLYSSSAVKRNTKAPQLIETGSFPSEPLSLAYSPGGLILFSQDGLMRQKLRGEWSPYLEGEDLERYEISPSGIVWLDEEGFHADRLQGEDLFHWKNPFSEALHFYLTDDRLFCLHREGDKIKLSFAPLGEDKWRELDFYSVNGGKVSFANKGDHAIVLTADASDSSDSVFYINRGGVSNKDTVHKEMGEALFSMRGGRITEGWSDFVVRGSDRTFWGLDDGGNRLLLGSLYDQKVRKAISLPQPIGRYRKVLTAAGKLAIFSDSRLLLMDDFREHEEEHAEGRQIVDFSGINREFTFIGKEAIVWNKDRKEFLRIKL